MAIYDLSLKEYRERRAQLCAVLLILALWLGCWGYEFMPGWAQVPWSVTFSCFMGACIINIILAIDTPSGDAVRIWNAKCSRAKQLHTAKLSSDKPSPPEGKHQNKI